MMTDHSKRHPQHQHEDHHRDDYPPSWLLVRHLEEPWIGISVVSEPIRLILHAMEAMTHNRDQFFVYQ